jgi:hypothetical protein
MGFSITGNQFTLPMPMSVATYRGEWSTPRTE